jgi:DNA invertase Pin-like site-specific DNA recombinase
MTSARKTAIYCRAALANDIAIARQEKQLREYAKEHGCAEPICFRDNGFPGNTLARPALNRLTAAIKAGEIGAVLVTNISRIARNFPLYTEWSAILGKFGVELITPQDGETESRSALTYTLVGDYLLPNIALSDPPDAPPLGYYGLRHKKYLREEKPALYAQLLLTERLYPLCREIDEAAAHRLATIKDRLQAEETINELIYE